MKIRALGLLCFIPVCYAKSPVQAELMENSEQLLMVTTADWHQSKGTLQRYQRATDRSWAKVGGPLPVAVGEKGLAWGVEIQDKSIKYSKHEGDKKTPAGVYALGPAFGFNPEPTVRLPFFQLTDTSVCVDDSQSQFYNQLVDSAKVKPDWQSGEKMREIPEYQWGMVVKYNMNPPVKKAGTCIFIHLFNERKDGTAGCIALSEANLKELLAWLEPEQHPIIAIFPKSAYREVNVAWHLPPL